MAKALPFRLIYGAVNVRKIAIVLVALAIIGPACAATGSPLGPSNADTAAEPAAAPSVLSSLPMADLMMCVDETNRYRASVGLRPLTRSATLEEFATRAAAVDGIAHVAHDHFAATNGAGISRAETEILWWQGFSVRGVIQRGLAQMWQVGPGGEHYDIMAGDFSEIGCGIAINGAEVTVTQDFR
jgi:cysteine-rich secretory family protein